MAETVQLDDFPYVPVLKHIDAVVSEHGGERLFYPDPNRPFIDPRDWGTLTQLLNDDFADLAKGSVTAPKHAGRWMLERIDAACAAAGAPQRLGALSEAVYSAVAEAIDERARGLFQEKQAGCPSSLDGRTVVMEFARGGPDGSELPLAAPYGYRHSLSQLSEAILERAVVLYIWVTPEESRRKNTARTDPNDPDSILHHGVPMAVMLGDYGCDDMPWLVDNAAVPGTLAIEAHGRRFDVPVGIFDNRVDKTSFLRGEEAEWPAESVAAIHDGLLAAFTAVRTAAL